MLPTAIFTLPPLLLRLAVAAPPTVSPDVPLVAPPTVVGVLGLRDASGALHTLRVDDVDGFSYVGDGVYVPGRARRARAC
jgi:hypothetical protein